MSSLWYDVNMLAAQFSVDDDNNNYYYVIKKEADKILKCDKTEDRRSTLSVTLRRVR